MVTKLSQKQISQILIVAKVIVIIMVFVLLYFKLQDQEDMIGRIQRLGASTLNKSWYLFIIILVLMPINWLIEAYKWKLLSAKLQSISLIQAMKGVLTGVTLGFVTPHAVGDYFGRILTTHHKERLRLIGAIFLGRISQMLTTGIFGMAGVYYLFGFQPTLIVIFSGLIIMLILIFFVKNKKVKKLVGRYMGIIAEYNLKQLLLLQFLSTVRYVVFSLQFCLLLYIVQPQLETQLIFAGVTWIFLAKSVLPSFNFLSDLGIREYSAVYFFEQYNVDVIPVIGASLLIWMINILLPTIAGLPFVMRLKWKNK
jgi:hypothetical protein